METKDPNELPFWFRQFISWSLKSAGIEKLPQRAESFPDYFDNTDGIGEVRRKLFYKHKSGVMLPFKGRPRPVDVGDKIGIEAHITAVSFGTTARSRKFWKTAIYNGLIPDELLAKYCGYEKAELLRNQGDIPIIQNIDKTATRLALHQRFWKVPYHYVGLRNGDILYNNSTSRYTYHGNGGNGPLVGVSLEGNYPGLSKHRKPKHDSFDDFIVQTGKAALRLSIIKERELGNPIRRLYAHRQYSDGRLGDPGQEWWEKIGLPITKEFDLEIDYKFKHGSGNLICREWDEKGLVDYRGRPI